MAAVQEEANKTDTGYLLLQKKEKDCTEFTEKYSYWFPGLFPLQMCQEKWIFLRQIQLLDGQSNRLFTIHHLTSCKQEGFNETSQH